MYNSVILHELHVGGVYMRFTSYEMTDAKHVTTIHAEWSNTLGGMYK